MKEFVTAIEEVTEPQDEMKFSLDGHAMVAYKPTEGQLAMLMSSIGRHTSDSTKIAGIIDFFVAVLDKSSSDYVVERLLSREDPLGIPQVQDIMEWMVEEWTGRPTKPLSVST